MDARLLLGSVWVGAGVMVGVGWGGGLMEMALIGVSDGHKNFGESEMVCMRGRGGGGHSGNKNYCLMSQTR